MRREWCYACLQPKLGGGYLCARCAKYGEKEAIYRFRPHIESDPGNVIRGAFTERDEPERYDAWEQFLFRELDRQRKRNL